MSVKSMIVAIALTVVAPAWAGNLVKNGDFEANTGNWSYDRREANPATATADMVYGGKKALCLFREKDVANYLYQAVKLAPGKDYTLSCYVKCDAVPLRDFSVRLLLWKKNSQTGKSEPCGWVSVPPQSGVIELLSDGGTHDWKEYKVRIPRESIPDYVTSTFLFLHRKNNSAGKVYVDEIVLEENDVIATEDK